MQHQQLVPSLNSAKLNPNIDFARSPFVVQQTLEPWHKPVLAIDGESHEYPRLAGISSFGAGGSNAHVIVEEYEAKGELPSQKPAGLPAIVLLSAKSAEQVATQAKNLRAFIQANGLNDAALTDLCYTLQTGREAMEVRAATTVDSVDTLLDRLEQLARRPAGDHAPDWQVGCVKKHKDALAVLTEDNEFNDTLTQWLARGKYQKLLDLWAKGLSFDWYRLYEDGPKPRRMSLPTYPFARERYWVETYQTAGEQDGDAQYETVYEFEDVEVEVQHKPHVPEWALQNWVPEWQGEPLVAQPAQTTLQRWSVLACGAFDPLQAAMLDAGAHCEVLAKGDDNLAGAISGVIEQVFERVQSHLRDYAREQSLLQVVIAREGTGSLLQALSGLLATAQQENPRLTTQLIEVDGSLGADQIRDILLSEQGRGGQSGFATSMVTARLNAGLSWKHRTARRNWLGKPVAFI